LVKLTTQDLAGAEAREKDGADGGNQTLNLAVDFSRSPDYSDTQKNKAEGHTAAKSSYLTNRKPTNQ
jgi:hypothetical protein